MSISSQGSERFTWVCRCSNGFRRTSSPAIHAFAGENVCIHAMTPMQWSCALASMQARRISAAPMRTGFQTRRTPISGPAFSRATISARLLGHLAQGLVAVKCLAAGQEPAFERFIGLGHVTSFGSLVFGLLRLPSEHSDSGSFCEEDRSGPLRHRDPAVMACRSKLCLRRGSMTTNGPANHQPRRPR